MRTIVILGVVLFAVIGCGNDEIRNSPLSLIAYGDF